jgi:hypothetical protein
MFTCFEFVSDNNSNQKACFKSCGTKYPFVLSIASELQASPYKFIYLNDSQSRHFIMLIKGEHMITKSVQVDFQASLDSIVYIQQKLKETKKQLACFKIRLFK